MGHSEGSPQRELHSHTAYLNKIETFQTNILTLCLQEPEEQQQRQPRASRRKKITTIKGELSDIETKSIILRINKSRSWFFEKIKKNQQAFIQAHQEQKRENPNKHNQK